MKNIFNNRILQGSILMLAGLFLGWLIFRSEVAVHHHDTHEHTDETTYTCSMHPQIRQNEPGDCPLCGMALIPLASGSINRDGSSIAVALSPEAMALASVQTRRVAAVSPEREILLTGKMAINEQRLAVITASYSGRIEKLFVDYTGQQVRKGEKLATIYSPELVTAQQELLEAAKHKEVNPAFYQAAREKLRLWRITESQASEIEATGKVVTELDIYADVSGIVIRREVSKGDYVAKGTVLFEIIDLSQMWVLLDAYESDLYFLRKGQQISFTVASVPGREFTSDVSFIDPFINPQTRTAAVRAEVGNPQQLLKPEMFVQGKIKANLPVSGKSLVVPSTAVLWTGKRSVVYVRTGDSETPAFEMREIILGASLGDSYLVENGLEAGEEIVVNGAFSIDAAAQLAGKPSMMNPVGGMVTSGHQHGTAKMGHQDQELNPGSTVAREPTVPVAIPDHAKTALQPLLHSYLKWKDALAADQFPEAQRMAVNMQEELMKVSESQFQGNALRTWIGFSGKLNESLEHVRHYSGIEPLRKAFQKVSVIMIDLSNTFRPFRGTVYVQHCPMADDNRGADWLSLEKEIRNPYFGSMMLTCGEVISEIK
jgi:Cu(I)/Ag(I) efflux system membrane fusion protein